MTLINGPPQKMLGANATRNVCHNFLRSALVLVLLVELPAMVLAQSHGAAVAVPMSRPELRPHTARRVLASHRRLPCNPSRAFGNPFEYHEVTLPQGRVDCRHPRLARIGD